MKLPHDLVHVSVPTPLGPMRLAATPRGLAGCWFDGQRHGPDMADWPQDEGHPLLREAARQLTDYLSGRRVPFDLPLDMGAGTAFQQAVWHALLTIPYGQTTSYGALAQQVGRPSAVRAVGAAVGRNPLGIVVPCHRVLGASGALTGYAAGLPRKQALLRLEGALA